MSPFNQAWDLLKMRFQDLKNKLNETMNNEYVDTRMERINNFKNTGWTPQNFEPKELTQEQIDSARKIRLDDIIYSHLRNEDRDKPGTRGTISPTNSFNEPRGSYPNEGELPPFAGNFGSHEHTDNFENMMSILGYDEREHQATDRRIDETVDTLLGPSEPYHSDPASKIENVGNYFGNNF